MRIVLDSNVIISGLISPKTPPGLLLSRWLEDEFTLVTSQQQLSELIRAFHYKRIKTRVRQDQARDLLGNIDTNAVIVDSHGALNVSPDPDDNVILVSAIERTSGLYSVRRQKGLVGFGPNRGDSNRIAPGNA